MVDGVVVEKGRGCGRQWQPQLNVWEEDWAVALLTKFDPLGQLMLIVTSGGDDVAAIDLHSSELKEK